MTQDQFGVLMNILQKSNPDQVAGNASSNQVDASNSSAGNAYYSLQNCSLGSWIIDSRATYHICGSVKWFHSYSEIIPINVRLPDGQILATKNSGTINFSPGFTMSNVLLIPKFSLNL